MMKHNKKKNARIMHGSLVRFIAEATFNKDSSKAEKGIAVAYLFRPGTALNNELEIHKTISTPIGCSKDKARRIIETAADLIDAVDANTLSECLREADEACIKLMGGNYYEKYKMAESDLEAATISQVFIDYCRKPAIVSESVDRNIIKDALVSIVSSAPKSKQVNADPDKNFTAFGLANEMFKKEYTKSLNREQLEVLDAHMVGAIKKDYTRYSRIAKARTTEAINKIKAFSKEKDVMLDCDLASRIDEVVKIANNIDVNNPDSINTVLGLQTIVEEIVRE
jgi:hypothetical protein